MNQFDRVFISIQFFIIVCFLSYMSVNLSKQNEEIGKKIDLVLETQRKTIDVNIKEVKILQEILKEEK